MDLNLTHNSDGTLTITQPKLLLKLFALYPPQKESMHKPTLHPHPSLLKESGPSPQPADTFVYLRHLGIILYLAKSRPDIMAAVSFSGTKSRNPRIGTSVTSTTWSNNTSGQRRTWDTSSICLPCLYYDCAVKSTRLTYCTPTARDTLATPFLSMGQPERSTIAA